MTPRQQLIRRLARLGVEERGVPDRGDGFSALWYKGKAFAHFHSDQELDLHLTKAVIEREGLVPPPNSAVHPHRSPQSPWIEVRFETAADVDHVVRLVQLALQRR